MPEIPVLEVACRDPFERGRVRGRWAADRLTTTWPLYRELFTVTARNAGRPAVDIASAAEPFLDALSGWAPELLRELEGVADGSGLDLSSVMALNARTEVLALARGSDLADGVTECSTVVNLAGREGTAVSAQTWDWHADLGSGWHLQTVRGDERTFVGLTEHGVLAKIGVNDAGLALHFNLLRHSSDGAPGGPEPRAASSGGISVHLLARQVLGRAASVAEAVEMLTTAPVAASSVLTAVAEDQAVSVEVSPAGAAAVRPSGEWLLHTNHFLDPGLACGERVTSDVTTTFERLDVLESRVKEMGEHMDGDGLVRLLSAHEEDGAAVCRHADPTAAFGYRTATLATVTADPHRRSADISTGGPCRRTRATRLVAA